MVRNADGSVIIDTELDSSDVVIGAKEIEKRIASFTSSVDRFGAKLQKATAGYASNAAEIMSREYSKGFEGVAAKLRDLANVKIPTDEYRKLNSEVEKVGTQLEKLLTRQEKLEELGVSKNTAQWKSLQYDIDQTGAKYDQLAAAKERMEADGSAYMLGSETEEYRKLNRELGTLQGGMSAGATRGQMFRSVLLLLGSTIKTVAGHALSLGKRFAQIGFNAVAAGAKKAANGLKAFISFARKAVSGLKSLKSQTRKTDLSTMGLVKSLTSLKRLLITRIKRMFISAIFNDVREGIQQLAKYSSAFDQQMSNMKNSAVQLNGNISVLIGNVISVVEPVITRIINLFAQGVDWINQFIAALQGKSTYTSAAKGADSYADATDKATKAQKNLNRELYSFDELNRQSGNESDANADAGSTFNFEEKTIDLPVSITDWIERLKGAWENADWKGVGRVIADGINAVFGKLDSLISWENIGDTITKIVTGIADILNSMVEGIDWQKIGRTFGSGINTIVNTLYLLLTSIDWYAIGKALATGLNGLVGRVDWDKLGRLFGARINVVFDTIRGFAENFKWGDAGTKFAEAINALKNEVNWYNLGDTLKKLLKGAVALMQYAVKTIEWGDAGTKFAKALNAFFEQDDLWAAAGDTIDETIKGLLDFTEKAVITFDEKQFADDLKALFRRVDWPGIATETWSLIKTTFKKFGNFLTVLFSDESNSRYDPWEKMYIPDPGATLGGQIGKKLHNALTTIPWDSIASNLWEAAQKALMTIGAEGSDFLVALLGIEQSDIDDAGGKVQAIGTKIAKTLSDALNSVLDFGKMLVDTFDPDSFRDGLTAAISNVRWGDIAVAILTGLGDAFRKLLESLPLAGELFSALFSEIDNTERINRIMAEIRGVIGTGLDEITSLSGEKGGFTFDAFYQGVRTKVIQNGAILPEFADFIHRLFNGDQNKIEAFIGGSMTGEEFVSAIGDEMGKGSMSRQLSNFFSLLTNDAKARGAESGTASADAMSDAMKAEMAAHETALRLQAEGVYAPDVSAKAEENAKKTANSSMSAYIGLLLSRQADDASAVENVFNAIWGNLDAEGNGEVLALGYMSEFLGTVTDEAGKVKPEFKDVVESMFGSVDPVEKSGMTAEMFLKGLVQGMWDSSGETSTKLVDIINSILTDVETNPEGFEQGSPSKRAARSGKYYMEGLQGGISDNADATEQAMLAAMNKVVGAVDTKVSEMTEKATTGAANMTNPIITGWEKAASEVGDSVGGMSGEVSREMGGITNDTLANSTEQREEVYRAWELINTYATASVEQMRQNVASSMRGLSTDIQNAMSEIANQGWWSVGDNIVAGIQSGVQDNWKWLQKTVRNLAISLYNTACQALGIHSPSKVFAEIGNFVDAGLQQGLEDGERNVLQTAANIADAVTKEMTPESPEVDVTADSVIGGMQAVINGLGGVADTFKVILDTIRSMGGLLTPQIAAGTVVPYKTKIDTTGSDNDDIIATLETLNGDLESVIIQAVNNAVIALVEAIQNNGGGNRTTDVKTLTSQVIDEINRRTRAQGTPPIIV